MLIFSSGSISIAASKVKPFLLLVVMLFSPLIAIAETKLACSIESCKEVDLKVSPFSRGSDFSASEIWTVLDDILNVSGLVPNFELVSTEEIDNAAAVIIDQVRYLAFNPDWLSTYRGSKNEQWEIYGVIAHEVGHHLQGHTITDGGSKPPTELEADEYAGFVLAGLGASQKQAVSLWDGLPVEGSSTHPARPDRLTAVTRGWSRWKGAEQTGSLAEDVRRISVPGEVCNDQFFGLARGRVCSSSILVAQSGNSYVNANLFDELSNTAWVEGKRGDGIGEYLTIEFNHPQSVSSIELINGYIKNNSVFKKNNRVRHLKITASNGKNLNVALKDIQNWQSISLDGFDKVEWIQLQIESVFHGTKYQDTALTELRLR